MEKEFKQLTLRNLDALENKDIVRIMNEYSAATGTKTGQSIIEGIIREYSANNRITGRKISEYNHLVSTLESEINNLKQVLQKHTNCMSNLKIGFKLLNEL